MKISIPIKALSINDAYTGRRFQTPELKQYKKDCAWFLNKYEQTSWQGEVELVYKFFLRNYGNTDVGNLEKALTDILVEMKLIPDDRKVRKITSEKFKGEDKIEIEIINIIQT